MASHSHLFFECQCAAMVWTGIRTKCRRHGGILDLLTDIQWGIQHCSKSVQSVAFQLSLAASVYYLWRERNYKNFCQIGEDSSALGKRIENEIKASMCSRRKVLKLISLSARNGDSF